MRRFTLFLLALALFPAALHAQAAGEVRGTVVAAATGQPLAAVRVAVRGAADTATVGSAVSGRDGRFRVAGLAPGRYRVEASLMGYQTFTGEAAVTAAAPAAELGTIRLAAGAVALQGLTVQAERSAVAVAPDRTIYSTRDMPVAAGGMATDVLRSVPELEVDINGGVQLRGTSAQIYLNGRPAPMQGEALQVFLQQLPADRIDRVEVIPNPSARFEAEGAGGIVNVVLKKNVDLGLSGNVFLNGGTRGEMGGGGRLAYQRGRLTLFGGSFLRMSSREVRSRDLRQNLLADPVTFLQQDARSDRSDLSGNLDLSAEWKLSERGAVFGEASTYRYGWDSDGVTTYTLMDALRAPTRRYDRLADSESRNSSLDLTLGYRHQWDPQRHDFSVEVEHEAGDDDALSRVVERALSVEGEYLGDPDGLTLQDNGGADRETAVRADYKRPWGEAGHVELGYRGELQRTEDQRLLEVFDDAGSPVPVEVTDRGFVHRENFHSAYVTLVQKLGRASFQGGLRAERADTRLEVPTGEEFDKGYTSLFPSANVSYDLGGGKQARLSYSRRIRRPGPWVLNPTNQSTDPLNVVVGNPDIDPVYSQSVSLETSWTGTAGTLRFSPYYRRSDGEWTQIKTVDAAGVSTLRWENIASIASYGTSLTASLRPSAGLSGSASVSGSREVRDASNLETDFSGGAWRWSARANGTARVTPTLHLQGMAFYMPGRDVPQGHMSSTLMTHLGLRKQLWNNKGSLNVMVTDPFNLWRSSFETRDPTHVQLGRSSMSMRRAVVSFSYSFGRPPRESSRGGEEEEQEAPGIR